MDVGVDIGLGSGEERDGLGDRSQLPWEGRGGIHGGRAMVLCFESFTENCLALCRRPSCRAVISQLWFGQ